MLKRTKGIPIMSLFLIKKKRGKIEINYVIFVGFNVSPIKGRVFVYFELRKKIHYGHFS
jgi:hypothetical protein